MTYRIEFLRDGTWDSEGIGDSLGWESVEEASAAIAGIADLGEEWLGDYRVVDESTDEVATEIEFCANQEEDATITDEQIEQLRDEAAQANDFLTVSVCNVALATGLADVAEIDEDLRSDLEAIGIIPEHIDSDVRARAECARVIAEAAAQVEEGGAR